MDDVQKMKELLSDKYREDMAWIDLEANAIHTVTVTFMEVCGKLGLEGEIINCLSMIEQSLAGMIITMDQRRERYENFILDI